MTHFLLSHSQLKNGDDAKKDFHFCFICVFYLFKTDEIDNENNAHKVEPKIEEKRLSCFFLLHAFNVRSSFPLFVFMLVLLLFCLTLFARYHHLLFSPWFLCFKTVSLLVSLTFI